MRRTPSILLGCLAAITLLVAGCGGDEVSKDEFSSKFAEAASGTGSPFDEEQATCLADAIYDEAGGDKINELIDELDAGSDFPEDLVDPLAKAGPACVSAGDLMADQLAGVGDQAQTDCIVSAINDDEAMNQQVWDAIAASAAGDDSKAEGLTSAITEATTSCLTG
ncbi:MAG: hypothetical protein R2754_13150 [Microthrixaceae bacterium]